MTIKEYEMDTVGQSNDQHSNANAQKSGTFKINEEDSKLRKCLRISKPMIPLKISLFLLHGGEATLKPFINLYILQLGVSISQLSFIIALNPIIQFIGSIVSGVVADKIGRSKPVLVANILLTALIMNILLLVPEMKNRKCFIDDVAEFQCDPEFSVRNIRNETVFRNSSLECFVQCNSEKLSYHTFTLYETNGGEDLPSNFVNAIPKVLNNTFYITDFSPLNATWTDSNIFCHSMMDDDCESFCSEHETLTTSRIRCPHIQDNSVLVMAICTIISSLYIAAATNCYRILDVTAMSMVKTHDSDFGRERFWSILGATLLPPLGSYLIDFTTLVGERRHCVTAIYFVDLILVLLMIAVYKLEVQINPPSRDMMKSSLKLFKNIDIVAFSLALLIIGTSASFLEVYSFIYLDQLGSPSILMGLMLGVKSVYGLPFLLTSNWWIRKFGCTNLLLWAFLGYVFMCLGYSFLQNPWHALIYETSSIFTYHLLWVAVVRHSHDVAPEGLVATVIACAGGIYWALGRGVGSIIGGQVMSKYGERWAFRLIAVLCGFSCIVYGAFLYFRKNKNQTKNEMIAK